MNRPLVSMLVKPAPIIIPGESSLRRDAPRPVKQQQKNYRRLFDDRSLFYDVFHTVEGITLSGPPLFNLKAKVEAAEIYVDGEQATQSSFTDLDRTQRSYIRTTSDSSHLRLVFPDFAATVKISPNNSDIFVGRKVLFTKSKDNDLKWIRDWTRFHVREHGIDGVLIYDNGSTDYSAEDVLKVVSGVKGIAVAVVVCWPFPFGPQGGTSEGVQKAPWDSDFCEYGIMEHARRRFLTQALGVINADIDELVIVERGGSIFDELERTGADVLLYTGRWIEAIGTTGPSIQRFSDFQLYDVTRPETTMKWSAHPTRIRAATQWKTHYIHGVRVTKTSAVLHRHFEGITGGWKREKRLRKNFDSTKHRVDSRLLDSMNRVFGMRMKLKRVLFQSTQETRLDE